MLPSLPSPGRSSFGAYVLNGRLYVVGGHTNETHHYAPDNFTAQGDVFLLDEKKWLPSPAMAPRPRPSQGFELFAHGQYLYALGGLVHHESTPGQNPENTFRSSDAIDRYDLSTNTWTTIAQLNQARSSYIAGVVGSKVYLLGGWYADSEEESGGKFLNSVESFDLETEKAEMTEFILPDPLRRACAAVTVKNQIVIIGGLDTEGSTLSQVLVFQPENSSIPWDDWTALPAGIFAPGASFDSAKNTIYIFGGYIKGDSNSTSAYELNLAEMSSWKELTGKVEPPRSFVQPVLIESGVYGLLGGADNPPGTGQQSDVFQEYNV